MENHNKAEEKTKDIMKEIIKEKERAAPKERHATSLPHKTDDIYYFRDDKWD